MQTKTPDMIFRNLEEIANGNPGEDIKSGSMRYAPLINFWSSTLEAFDGEDAKVLKDGILAVPENIPEIGKSTANAISVLKVIARLHPAMFLLELVKSSGIKDDDFTILQKSLNDEGYHLTLEKMDPLKLLCPIRGGKWYILGLRLADISIDPQKASRGTSYPKFKARREHISDYQSHSQLFGAAWPGPYGLVSSKFIKKQVT